MEADAATYLESVLPTAEPACYQVLKEVVGIGRADENDVIFTTGPVRLLWDDHQRDSTGDRPGRQDHYAQNG